VALRARELEAFEPAERLFVRGDPNPVAEQRFGAVFRPLIGEPPRCPYTLECRGVVCRAQVLLPANATGGHRSCFGPSPHLHAPADWALKDYLGSRRSFSFGNDTPVRDPLSGKSFKRIDVHYRLASATAERMPLEQRPPMVELSPRRQRSTACTREVARLQGELAAVLARGDEALRPEEAFAINEPSPSTAAEVLAVLPGVTGLAGEPFPLRVECRGTVCTIQPREPGEPRMEIKRVCEVRDGLEQCRIDRDHDGWFSRLSGLRRHPLIARVEEPTPRRPAYLRVRSALERSRLDPFEAACAFGERVEREDVIASCLREAAGAGTLDVKLSVPGPDEPDRHIVIDHAGELAGTPLGRCLVDRLREIAAAVELPATRHSLVVHRSPTFPGARDLWAGRPLCPPR
jgi:hypothetical protein